jgi:hypothetical protein
LAFAFLLMLGNGARGWSQVGPGGSASQATASSLNLPTYFVFGTVVSIGQRTIDVQSFDERRQRTVQHSFVLSKDSRADVVRIGDAVEVIFTPGIDWTIRRLLMLSTGIPKTGPPLDGAREVPAATPTRLSGPASGGRVPGTTRAAVGGGSVGTVSAAAARGVALPTGPAASGKNAPPANAIDLGRIAAAKTVSATDVPLGAGDGGRPKAIKTQAVAFEVPREECNRGSAEWPNLPLRLAVLDFRYPTEREEAHDIGTTGGGSGTAVADLVFASLDQLNEFAMSRGDRTRLYRADFAGAARAGRELGADAVLAGTFQPQDPPPNSDPDFPPPKIYELRAGIVDTCTGQLLQRLTSVVCPPGLDPNAAANGASCKRLAVTAKQASDPKDQAGAFAGPIAALLSPLVHNGPPAGTVGSAGVVTSAEAGNVTIRLVGGGGLKAGDQVALHAWRLTKNPTTYTLHNLHDEEIGRVTLTSVQGSTANGTFLGDFPAKAGDTAELIGATTP